MTTYNVSNATELQSALTKAIGGDTVLLAGGNYGTVTLSKRVYASNVTIQSASTTNQAHFDGLTVSGSKNLTLSGLDLGRALNVGEKAEYTTFNKIYSSTNISLVNNTIHGSRDGISTNDGNGLLVRDSNYFTMSGNTFDNLYRGSFIQRGANHVVKDNLYTDLRVDGATFAAVDRTTVEGNTFRDFHWIAGDHPDGIQFWNTNETRGSTNVTIKNNVVMQHDGVGTQGIWISDAGAYGYKNFVIENNLVYGNDLWNGISVNGGTGIKILGNSILSSSGDSKQFWIRLSNTSQVVVQHNATDNIQILSGVTGLTQSDNLILAKTPSAKSLFHDLLSPDSVQDLIVSGYGYQIPNTSVSIPAPAPAPAPAPNPWGNGGVSTTTQSSASLSTSTVTQQSVHETKTFSAQTATHETGSVPPVDSVTSAGAVKAYLAGLALESTPAHAETSILHGAPEAPSHPGAGGLLPGVPAPGGIALHSWMDHFAIA